jgi:hypothetical protein
MAGITAARLEQIGRTVQGLVLSMEQAAPPDSPASSYLVSGDRIVRGWTLQLLLYALLIPPALALLDLATRVWRRRAERVSATRALLTRLWAPLTFVLVLRIEGLLGLVPGVHEPPYPGNGSGLGVYALALPLLAAIGAHVAARGGRSPHGSDPAEAGVTGYVAAIVAVGAASLLVLVSDPYDLVLLLPALHLWLLLPLVSRRGAAARTALTLAGWAGIAWLCALLATSEGLGAAAPAWLLRMAAVGAVPLGVSLAVAVLWASTSQLLAIASGRYAR